LKNLGADFIETFVVDRSKLEILHRWQNIHDWSLSCFFCRL